jgi:hypothetical protein
MSHLRRTQRLGIGGEYVPPGPNPYWQAQFLEAVAKRVPACVAELRKLAPQLPDVRTPGGRWDAEAPLRAWCEKWGFVGIKPKHGTFDWLRNVARRTAGTMRDDIKLSGFVPVVAVWRGPSKVAAPGPWDPCIETETAYDARICAYKARVRQEVERQGWRRNDEKRTAEHIEWLALYQVGSLSLAKIAERFDPDGTGSPDVNTVRLALPSTAALVGVALRPLPRGRPRQIRGQTRAS